MISRIVSCLLLILGAAAQSAGQAMPVQYRISGKTVSASTAQILPDVEVWAMKAGQSDITAETKKVLTGDDGAFTFTGLESGKYQIVGQRNGYRRQGFEQHGLYVSAVVVGAGIDSEHIVFRLHPDARIVGTVVDEDDEPVRFATVFLFRADANGGLAQTYLITQTLSDDRGHYRFPHLEPGSYFLVVAAHPWFAGFAIVNNDESHRTAVEQSPLDVAFPTTFYPGVTDAASASHITLNDGEEFAADFVLTAVPAVRLRLGGLSTDPSINSILQQRVFGTTISPTGQRQTPMEGSVEIGGIPPGRYLLKVESYNPSFSTRMSFVDLTSGLNYAADLASAPPVLSGTIHMDGKLNLQPQAFVRLWDCRTHEMFDTQIDQNGEFHFDAGFLRPGSYSVFVVNGENSIIASLSAIGARVLGQSIQVRDEKKPIRLSIAVSSTLSAIDGTALRDRVPLPGAMVLLVPENPEINLPLFRRDESDSDGTFTLRDVLPGSYWILAIENGWNMEWADPAFLTSHLNHAATIDVQAGKIYRASVNVE